MSRCRDARERAQEILDSRGDPSADAAIARHASSCSSCAEYVHGLTSLSRVAAVAASSAYPSDSAEAVRRRVRASLQARVRVSAARGRQPAWRPALAWTASAAVLLLVGVQVGMRMTASPLAPSVAGPAGLQPTALAPLDPTGPPDLIAVADAAGAARPAESSPSTEVVLATEQPTTQASTAPGVGTARPPIIPQGRSRMRNRAPSQRGPAVSDLEAVSAPGRATPSTAGPARGGDGPGDRAPLDDRPMIVIVPGQGL